MCTKNGYLVLCHTHRTACHKYMTYARMLAVAIISISRETQGGESEISVAAMD